VTISVILNSSAGNRRADMAADIADAFAAAGVTAEVTSFGPGEDPAAAARRASAHADVVVAAGGDGTVSSVANAVVDSRAALGVLPAGTLNHFAKDLALPLDLAGAAARIAAGRIIAVDVGEVNGRIFLNNSSIGLYPSIVKLRDELRRQGHGKWIALAIASWRLVRAYRGVIVRMTVDGTQASVRTPFILIANNEYTISGTGLGTRTAMNAGRLFIYSAPRVRARDLPVLCLRALLGHAVEPGAFEIRSGTELWIETMPDAPIDVAVDGETMVMRAPLHYQARPGALRVVA
jgi:diacylglycerol kinase family enzyme